MGFMQDGSTWPVRLLLTTSNHAACTHANKQCTSGSGACWPYLNTTDRLRPWAQATGGTFCL